MLCANKATVRLCEVLYHFPAFEQLPKLGNSVQRGLRQGYHHVVLPRTSTGTETPEARALLMQWCSFSQSRVYYNQSEMKEASNRQELAQSKRSLEGQGDAMADKRSRFDPDYAFSGLANFTVPGYEWQHHDVASVASSCHQVVPIYEAENLQLLDEPQAVCGENSADEVLLEDMAVEEKKEMLLKRVHQLRPWQFTDLGRRKLDGGMEFTLMSYNILAQDLLEDNCYLYGHCDQNVLDWDFRCQNLFQEIEVERPDILCLQELTQTHYEEYFHPRLSSLGWSGLYKKRTGGKPDGCAIFFKRSAFQLESYASVEYFKPGYRLLNRDNVGLIALLKPAGAGENAKLCVATTHLLFNPRRGDIKLSQLQLLLAELDRVAFRGQDATGRRVHHPVILCGDMNSEPGSPLYHFLTSGSLVYQGLLSGDVSGQREGLHRGSTIYATDLELPELGISRECRYLSINGPEAPGPSLATGCLRHHFDFASAYGHASPTNEALVTTHNMKACCTVDYVLYSGKTQKSGPLDLLGTRRLLTQREVRGLGGLPNAALSSDHLSLSAKFSLNLTPHKS